MNPPDTIEERERERLRMKPVVSDQVSSSRATAQTCVWLPQLTLMSGGGPFIDMEILLNLRIRLEIALISGPHRAKLANTLWTGPKSVTGHTHTPVTLGLTLYLTLNMFLESGRKLKNRGKTHEHSTQRDPRFYSHLILFLEPLNSLFFHLCL